MFYTGDSRSLTTSTWHAKLGQMETTREKSRAALRSALVSKLTGLSRSQLQYWHKTALQRGTTHAGAPGDPRLYSWRDYRRLRLIARLIEADIPTANIRRAVEYLDAYLPEWHHAAISSDMGAVQSQSGSGRRHVVLLDAHEGGVIGVLADASGQSTYRLPEGDSSMAASLAVFRDYQKESPLARLSRFDDSVTMNPDVNVGLPSLVGSRLETAFIARIVKLTSESEIALLYELSEEVVKRAVEFEEAA